MPGPDPTDLELLGLAREGDHEAGRVLVGRHAASMVRTARCALGWFSGADAEDVVQEALIAALTTDALPSSDVGAWLRAITVRKSLDCLRRAGRRGEQPLPRAYGAGEPAAAGPQETPADILALRQGLERLPVLDRAVLVLVDLEGLSMAQAAAALGSTRVAVRLRASRARRRLARTLGGRRGQAPQDRGVGEGVP